MTHTHKHTCNHVMCVRLQIRELACVNPEACVLHLQSLVDLVATAALNNFEGAPKLRETVWRCLPTIAKAIGEALAEATGNVFANPTRHQSVFCNLCAWMPDDFLILTTSRLSLLSCLTFSDLLPMPCPSSLSLSLLHSFLRPP